MASARFTDELRALAGAKWDAVIKHKFTDELAAGTIDHCVLSRYLIQDHRFLDSFVVLLSSMVAAAPTLADRIPGCQFLALITGRENTYFERSFNALGISEELQGPGTPDAPPTIAFNQLMREAAKASYPEMLAVLVVAEWTYQSWGERVLPAAVAEPFMCREWVDLHSGEYFGSVRRRCPLPTLELFRAAQIPQLMCTTLAQVVEYLRGLLDSAGAALGVEERAKVEAAFLKAVDIEVAFFDNAYDKE